MGIPAEYTANYSVACKTKGLAKPEIVKDKNGKEYIEAATTVLTGV